MLRAGKFPNLWGPLQSEHAGPLLKCITLNTVTAFDQAQGTVEPGQAGRQSSCLPMQHLLHPSHTTGHQRNITHSHACKVTGTSAKCCEHTRSTNDPGKSVLWLRDGGSPRPINWSEIMKWECAGGRSEPRLPTEPHARRQCPPPTLPGSSLGEKPEQ